jgi:hypothetical protein
MPKRRTLRKLHIYSGLFSAAIGIYLWLEPKWRRWRRKVGESR